MGLVAGTTCFVGLPGTSAGCCGARSRAVDGAQNGLGGDQVQTSALYPPSDPNGVCTNYASGKTKAFLLHAGEGVDAAAAAEFARLGTMTTTPNCLYAPQPAITLGVAFSPKQNATMATYVMKQNKTPQTNETHNNTTADIP